MPRRSTESFHNPDEHKYARTSMLLFNKFRKFPSRSVSSCYIIRHRHTSGFVIFLPKKLHLLSALYRQGFSKRVQSMYLVQWILQPDLLNLRCFGSNCVIARVVISIGTSAPFLLIFFIDYFVCFFSYTIFNYRLRHSVCLFYVLLLLIKYISPFLV